MPRRRPLSKPNARRAWLSTPRAARSRSACRWRGRSPSSSLAGLVAAQLAQHRRQAGCGPTNLIRAINGWLWRSVYQEDRFDQLDHARQPAGPDCTSAGCCCRCGRSAFWPVWCCGFPCSSATRSPPRWSARASSTPTAAAARLIGAQDLGRDASSGSKIVDFTWEGILTELPFLYKEQQLPDSLPHCTGRADGRRDARTGRHAAPDGHQGRGNPLRQSAQRRRPAGGRSPPSRPTACSLARCRPVPCWSDFDAAGARADLRLLCRDLRRAACEDRACEKMSLPGDPPPPVRKFGKVTS